MIVQASSAKENVDIVLATYNGGKYLAAQLESLLAQRHDAIRILISDDGSTDDTVEVIQAYCARDVRVRLMNASRQGGVVANFSKALSFATADYVMFCDQDDVWLDTKVGTMLAALQARERAVGVTTPLLGFSDLNVVDVDLLTEHQSFYKSHGLDPALNKDPRYLAWSSTVYGCTTIFNHALVKLGKTMPAALPMHDQWMALLAASSGEVFYEPNPTILYRQHGANVVGGKKRTFMQRLASFRANLDVLVKDVKKCRLQYDCASALFINRTTLPPVFTYKLDSIGGRFTFVCRNVLPFIHERTAYALLFAVFFLSHGDDQ